jgi:hypothetical protein
LYSILYDDGARESNVAPILIKLLGAPSTPEQLADEQAAASAAAAASTDLKLQVVLNMSTD